ncbi:MAG: PSD1 domain-containing protein [Planctomycetaceae bacterium]|nr:PSD1 domain-containing protein [Planctomycetaceae bacterium]
MRISPLLVALIGINLTSAASLAVGEDLTFEQHIRPIFRQHCFDCHGAEDEKKGNLDLRLVRLMSTGGDSGAAIVTGNPDESLLIQRVRAGEMPPGEAKVTPEELAVLESWVSAGARTARPEPESIGPGLGVTPEERAFWSFQPIKRPEIPTFPEDARVRTPIDALLIKEIQPEGLGFSLDADRHTLMLRAYFDLIGLPPTADEAERFLSDASPDAYAKLIDELLQSPHYGERWGRHWLDIAGYADSEGGTDADAERPWAWRYRDYVIRSFNADKPFDQFIIEQLAGDEMAGPQEGDLTDKQIELLTATGFLRMAADGTGSGADNPEGRNQVIADTISIVGTSLLGLSLGCAQCHDHRYDPIPQSDYFAIRATLEPALDWQSWKTPPQRQVSLYTAADHALAAKIEAEAQKVAAEREVKQTQFMAEALTKELEKYEEPLRTELRTAYETADGDRTDEQKALLKEYPSVNISPGVLYQYNQAAADDLKKFDTQIAEIRAKKPEHEYLRALVEPAGHAPVTKLFHRGDYRSPKFDVEPASLTVTAPEGERPIFPSDDELLPTTGRRLAFAKSLTNGRNPLVARTIVNRIWLHHFGRGLVGTPSDFGRLGTPPSHPELLDWLADEFMASGWRVSHLHKLIMTSTAYQQSSVRSPQAAEIDPENQYYSRKPLQRLEAEVLRDRMLATTGHLDRTLFGKPVPIKEDDVGQVIVDESQHRRGIYIQQRRSRPVALMQAFDAPVMQVNCDMRQSSTVATQSLMLMNGEFVLSQAKQLAQLAEANPDSTLDEQTLATLPEVPSLLSPWQFGYGSYSPEISEAVSFQLIPHWTGSGWQGGAELPDPQTGWVILNAGGGHPGGGAEQAVIRRWVSPASGQLKITGSLHHPSENGDGVCGRVVSSRAGQAGEWVAQHSTVETPVEGISVEAGDTIDFITDCREQETSDSFGWSVTLTLTSSEGTTKAWSSESGFHGPESPEPPPLAQQASRAWKLAYFRPPTHEELEVAVQFLADQLNTIEVHQTSLPEGVTPSRQAMTNLCQALLTSNEFLYID